ncbi:hypothetical protein HPG69_006822, partial [Diceros bicornis minor]
MGSREGRGPRAGKESTGEMGPGQGRGPRSLGTRVRGDLAEWPQKTRAPEHLVGLSVFIFSPKPKDTLTNSQTPEVTCVVVDVSPEPPDVQFTWYMDNKEVNTATTMPNTERLNSTYRVVSVLPIQHQDWLSGKEFKCKVNSRALPAPIEKTISKAKGRALMHCTRRGSQALRPQLSPLGERDGPTEAGPSALGCAGRPGRLKGLPEEGRGLRERRQLLWATLQQQLLQAGVWPGNWRSPSGDPQGIGCTGCPSS